MTSKIVDYLDENEENGATIEDILRAHLNDEEWDELLQELEEWDDEENDNEYIE